MKYDDAEWHNGGDFPKNSPPELGGTHIALFLKYCFKKGWIGELHLENRPEEVNKVINDELSATDFLFKYCYGQLNDEDLDEEGNKFAEQYYGDNGLYLNEVGYFFGHVIYKKGEEYIDFVVYAKILDLRLQSGVLTKK